jgi:inner membrane protein
VGICSGVSVPGKSILKRFLFFSILCAIIPDADVIGFKLGIPYSHVFGHRGFFHSLVFAFIFGLLVSSLFFKGKNKFVSKSHLLYWLYFFLLTASHGILDTLTNGGLGIALLSPFSNQRFFFWDTPIKVSPIGIAAFLNKRSLLVIKSEMLWVWLPLFTLTTFIRLGQIFGKKKQEQDVTQ